MIVEVGGADPRSRGLSRAALPIVLACIVAALAMPADRSGYPPLDQLGDLIAVRALALPPDVTGVRLAAMPDRLLNDQPLSSLVQAVQVRGREAVASHENGTTTIMWTERGTVYWLTSTKHDIVQLAAIGDRLMLATLWPPIEGLRYDREGRRVAEQP